MIQVEAPILARETFDGGWQRLRLRLPQVAGRAQPGQLLAVRGAQRSLDPLLRRPMSLAGADAAAGTITLLWEPERDGDIEAPPGASLDLLGPIGHGWSLAGTTRNVLLVGAVAHVGALLFLAEIAARRSCNVALLVGGPDVGPEMPPTLAPPSIEYQFGRGSDAASAALELLDAAQLRWADALYTTLPIAVYPALAQHIRGARVRWEPSFAHGLLTPPMSCFVGICDGCRIDEARRPWRACVDGPQCDVRDFVR